MNSDLLRTVAGVYDVSTTSTKDPVEILEEISRVLNSLNINFSSRDGSGYQLLCETTDQTPVGVARHPASTGDPLF